MLCEKCHKNEAEVAVQEVINGEKQELYVCKECVAEPLGRKLIDMVGALFGLATQLDDDLDIMAGDDHDLKCPQCRITRSEFRKGERLGCAACYETFKRDLAPIIRDMHRGTSHVGKMPVSERLALAQERLAAKLKQAVARECFEEAAQLRDQIAAMQADMPSYEEWGRHAAT